MSNSVTIPVKAVVNSNEEAAVALAATLLESSLSAEASEPFAVRCQFESSSMR